MFVEFDFFVKPEYFWKKLSLKNKILPVIFVKFVFNLILLRNCFINFLVLIIKI